MTQVANGLNIIMWTGNENPNGWLKGRVGGFYIDNLACIYYQCTAEYVWRPMKNIVFSADYKDLINAPVLSTVANSGKYADLLGIPDLSIYATNSSFGNVLDNKVDKVVGKGLSTNDYTNAEKDKLANLNISYLVTSVSGKTGAVVLTKSDIGLGNVDNTSDINKPISTATQTSLDTKVDKVNGKQLSTNDYTTAEKVKLASLTNITKSSISNVISRSFNKATAYQATDTTKDAVFIITLSSTSSLSLSGNVTQGANIYVGSTNAVATNGGGLVAKYVNALGGALSISISLTNTQSCSYTVYVPAGFYISVNNSQGTGVTIDNVIEHAISLA